MVIPSVARDGQAHAVRLRTDGPHHGGLQGAIELDLGEAVGLVALHHLGRLGRRVGPHNTQRPRPVAIDNASLVT